MYCTIVPIKYISYIKIKLSKTRGHHILMYFLKQQQKSLDVL